VIATAAHNVLLGESRVPCRFRVKLAASSKHVRFSPRTGHRLALRGLTSEIGLQKRIEDLARAGVAWALPNMLLGAPVIVPVWFLFYLFRPPGESRD
jgi:Family of unknown function (DUF6460)